MPINNYKLLNTTGLFIRNVLEQGLHPISRDKLLLLGNSPNIHQSFRLYPKMHHFVSEMCTRVHWCIEGYVIWDSLAHKRLKFSKYSDRLWYYFLKRNNAHIKRQSQLQCMQLTQKVKHNQFSTYDICRYWSWYRHGTEYNGSAVV